MQRKYRAGDQRGSVNVQNKTSDWKDHPLFVAIASGSAAIVFMSQVITPIQMSYVNNKMEQLQDKVDNVEKLETELSDVKNKLGAAQTALTAAINANLFSHGNPYANGLQQVHIGDRISKIDEVFDIKIIDKSKKSYYTVKIDHPFFSSATFYFTPSDKDPKIHNILYFTKDDNARSKVLIMKLTEALGEPAEGQEDNELQWPVANGIYAYTNIRGTYQVRSEPYYSFKPRGQINQKK